MCLSSCLLRIIFSGIVGVETHRVHCLGALVFPACIHTLYSHTRKHLHSSSLVRSHTQHTITPLFPFLPNSLTHSIRTPKNQTPNTHTPIENPRQRAHRNKPHAHAVSPPPHPRTLSSLSLSPLLPRRHHSSIFSARVDALKILRVQVRVRSVT